MSHQDVCNSIATIIALFILGIVKDTLKELGIVVSIPNGLTGACCEELRK
jgi:hypothetical protein